MMKFIIPIGAVAVSSLLAFTNIDNKIADLFQRVLPSTNENESVSMINVNDDSIEHIGTWPFSREVYARSIVTLKELNAKSLISDLSFIDKSQAQVKLDYVLNDIPQMLDSDFSDINSNFAGFLEANEGTKISANNIQESSDEFSVSTQEILERIKDYVAASVKDVDSIFANSIFLFDNTYLTLTLGNNFSASDETNSLLKEKIALKNINTKNDTLTPEYKGIQPAINQLLNPAKSAGFVNAQPDKDGYTRRINIISKYNGDYYGQLIIPSLLNELGNPEIEVTNKYITLKNAVINGIKKDISIPRSEKGQMLLKYPKKTYSEYKAVSLWEIYLLNELESSLVQNLNLMNENGFFDSLTINPYDTYDLAKFNIDTLLTTKTEDVTFNDYIEVRNQFFNELETLFNDETEKSLIEQNIQNAEVVSYIKDTFAISKANYDKLKNARNNLKEKVEGRTLIIGTTATSTTDYGLNQYEEHYPNPGVHYTVLNQILSEDFVDDSPVWVSILIALIICLAYVFSSSKSKNTAHQIVFGIGLLFILTIAFVIFFMITKTYIGTAIPISSLTISFITITIIGFLNTSKDKKFITSAFSQCLSPDVVKQLIDDPSSFKLGGARVQMSALFTDIQKFSSFSELLTAAQLVALLNYYLTQMSDIIMSERGTVDKYEGDAIVAFIGAPILMEDHAIHACKAAIKMKKAEAIMNKNILEYSNMSFEDFKEIVIKEKLLKQPNNKKSEKDNEDFEQSIENLYTAFKTMVKNNKSIFTRIGINSGEMIAGYMGSDKKKNYTMMGNNVNLASRLEGVNKQYSTLGILISEHTKNLLEDKFIVRSLDRVQVVNVKTPLRLYELIAEKEDSDEKLIKYVNAWEKIMKCFESREYEKTLDYMKKLVQTKLEQYPEDKVAKYYINLLERFFVQGKYPTANDDVGVSFNNENGVFTLLQK